MARSRAARRVFWALRRSDSVPLPTMRRLTRRPLKSWAAGPDPVWIRIAIESISGRELDQPEHDD